MEMQEEWKMKENIPQAWSGKTLSVPSPDLKDENGPKVNIN